MRFLVIFFLFISLQVFSQKDQNLRFIENKGQWNEQIDFQAMVPGGRLGVSATGFHVQLLDMDKMDELHMEGHEAISEATGRHIEEPINAHYFQINLVGANKDAKIQLEHPLDGYYNYFVGSDTCKWKSNVLAYETIVYKNVYNGIDFRISSNGQNLKYDFMVMPMADPSQINIEYCGISTIEKWDDDLKIETMVGSLLELKPVSYQFRDHTKQFVASEFRLTNNNVTFSFPEDYDECSELVIDPLLIFSTYSGSTADNWGSTATPGEHGTLYSAGVTKQDLGGAFPATVGAYQTTNNGKFDIGILKYDSAGTKLLYATYLGGSNNDSPKSLVVDGSTNDLIVLGISSSPDFPTSTGAFDSTFNFGTNIFNRVFNTEDQWDIALTRLTSTGDQLIGSTYLGGSGNDGLNTPKQSGGPLVVNYGDEMRGDVITDSLGYVYVNSVTASSDFPIVNGYDSTFNGITDGVVAKFNPDLSSLIWSSYIGGSEFDAAYSIKLDMNNTIVLAGGTSSADFPMTAGSYQTTFNGIVDGWIVRISGDGRTLLNATFTGTLSFDQVYFIDLNSSGSVFCYGQTAGNMPITPGVYSNPGSGQFLQKLSPDLSTLEFSTVFGSGTTGGLVIPNISPTAFLVNDCDNIYLAGWGGFVNSSPQTGFWQSTTEGMPITEDAYQETTSGSDFYFMVLNGNATQLVYSTYLGGNSSKTHVDGGTSRFDKYGIVYHSVCSGCSYGNETGQASSDFPTTPNAHSRVNRSLNCNNAAFKFDLSSLRALFETNNTTWTMPGFNNVCYPDTIVFQNISIGGKDIKWDFGDGTIVEQTDEDPKWLYHQYQQEGQYPVKLIITDLSTCSQVDSVIKIINYFKEDITVGDDAFVCEGASYQLTASGAVSYYWTGTDPSFSSTEQNPIVWPENVLTSYFVTAVDADGCSKTDTVNLYLILDVQAGFQTFSPDYSTPDFNNVCFPDSILFENQSINGENYLWEFGDGTLLQTTNADTSVVFHSYEQEGEYEVKLKAFNSASCNNPDVATKTIHYFKDEITIGEDGEICEGSSFQLSATGGADYQWTTEEGEFTSSQSSPVVQPVNTTSYYVTVTDANNCIRKDTLLVRVINRVELDWDYQLLANCTGLPAVFVQNFAPDQDEIVYTFDFGDGISSTESEVVHSYENEGTYSLKFMGEKENCGFGETVEIPVYNVLIPNVITPNGSPGLNDEFQVAFGSALISPLEAGMTIQLIVLNRWGEVVFESADYKNDWNGKDLDPGVYYVQVKIGEQTTCKNWLQILK